MVVGIHHVQISMAPEQIASSRKFYMELLGMREIHDPFASDGGCWLAAGPSQQVHLRVERTVDRSTTRAHPALMVSDLADCRERLTAEKFPIFEQPKIEGFDRIHTIDPSGNRIEVIQPDGQQV